MDKSASGTHQQQQLHKKTKTSYIIDNPFCQIKWPTIESTSDQDLILELLCTLLAPIGDHRLAHVNPTVSKGKRERKRAKEEARRLRKTGSGERTVSGTHRYDEEMEMQMEGVGPAKFCEPSVTSTITTSLETITTAPANHLVLPPPPPPPVPPPPEISKHLTIGLNSITTHLTSLVSLRLPPNFPSTLHLNPKKPKPRKPAPAQPPTHSSSSSPHLTTIFLTRSDSQPTPLHAHLPLLTFLASPSNPTHPTLLVPLPKGSSVRLQQVLGIPSVNFIGLLSTLPETGTGGALLQLVRRVVRPVSVPWLETGVGDATKEGEGSKEEEGRGKEERDKGDGDSSGGGAEAGDRSGGLFKGDYQPLRVRKLKTTIGLSKKQKGKQSQSQVGGDTRGKK